MKLLHIDTLDSRPADVETPARGRAIMPTLREATMKFSELSGKYLQYATVHRGHSPHTIDQYTTSYKQFESFLRMTGKVDDIRYFESETVEAFMLCLLERGASRNTVRHRLTALSSLAKWALTQRVKGKPLLAANPVVGFEWPQREVPETKFLYPEELRALMELEVPLHERVALELLVKTGLRVSELVKANCQDVVEDARGHAVLSVTVKGRARREVRVHKALSPDVVALLKDWRLHRNLPDPEEPLLVSRHGTRWTRLGLTDMVRRQAVKAGITRIIVRAHVLRHTYAVLSRKAGLDDHTRSRLLHHQSPQSLARYEHLLPDELREAEDRVGDTLARYIQRPASAG